MKSLSKLIIGHFLGMNTNQELKKRSKQCLGFGRTWGQLCLGEKSMMTSLYAVRVYVGIIMHEKTRENMCVDTYSTNVA